MQRGLVALATAALLCGVCYALLRSAAASGREVADLVLLTASATLALALTAAVFGVRASLRAGAIQAELARLSRSFDAAIRDLSAKAARETATVDDLAATLAREIEQLTARSAVRPRPVMDIQGTRDGRDNIVALPTQKRGRVESIERAPAPAPFDGFEFPLQRAIAAGDPDLSLQPIVSIQRGAAVGFEVFAHIQRDDGTSANLRRLPLALPGVPQAAFETWLVRGAVRAVQGKLAVAGEGLPLHVSVTEAVLLDDAALAGMAEIFREAPDVTRTVLLSMPASILERPGRHAEALEILSDLGVRIAADLGAGTKETLETLKRNGVPCIRVGADRLLGRAKTPKSALAPARLLEVAANLDLPVIAVGVVTDEDAVTLIDLGVTLMTGDRFSAPRRLKPALREQGRERIA